jgi:hypothetical protein
MVDTPRTPVPDEPDAAAALADYAKTLHRIAYPGAYEGSAEWSRQQAFAALKRNGGTHAA